MTPRLRQAIAGIVLLFIVCRLDAAQATATAVSKADRVNVRSRPGFVGEIVTQLQKDQAVTVLDTVTLRRPAPDEPPVWIKIQLPGEAPAWANSEFVDPSTGVVLADVLNVRAGPTYDHAVLARVKKGATLKLAGTPKDGWVQVAAPPGAAGFVPATWLSLGSGAGSASANTPATAAAAARVATTPVPAPTATTNTPVAPVTAAKPAPVPQTTSKETAAPKAAISNSVVTLTPPPKPVPATANGGPGTGTQAAAAKPAATPKAPSKPVPSVTTRTASDNAWLEQFVRTNAPASVSTASTNRSNVSAAVPASASEAPSSEVVSTKATVTPVVPKTAAGKPATGSAVGPAVVSNKKVSAAPAAAAASASPIADRPMGRWVRREGVVVRSGNIAAPSHYALKTRDRGTLINFLISTRPDPVSLKEFRGRVVTVTGREYLDRRDMWRTIPLLDVETLESVR